VKAAVVIATASGVAMNSTAGDTNGACATEASSSQVSA